MGIMEKKMETIVMGYIGFRVWSFGGLGHRGMGKKKNATVSRVLDSWWTLLSAEFRILALGLVGNGDACYSDIYSGFRV